MRLYDQTQAAAAQANRKKSPKVATHQHQPGGSSGAVAPGSTYFVGSADGEAKAGAVSSSLECVETPGRSQRPVALLRRSCSALHGSRPSVAPEGGEGRQGGEQFIEAMREAGWECQQSAVPPAYHRNVLDEGSDEEFELLFDELKTRTYTLYCYSRKAAAPASE